ncbi:hypothetical protein E2986_12355 [Frieseomelitta varia]|uniref:Ionotropic glutamate receptor C-terminal domain-containing protein n=1 Tax=Frieseomelitta varia TaxID=561572 RepID=A0A833VIW8_9HYME|nr:hypothetical protein E2986_12355 [Frieseomelitta varia]
MARMTYTRLMVVLLLLSVSTFSVDVNNAYKYIHLIKDVHYYYETSCIITVFSNCHDSKFRSLFSKILTFSPSFVANDKRRSQTIIVSDFNETSLAFTWSRAFSQLGILTTSVRFSELPRETRTFQSYMRRPLYVVILTTKENMDEFSMATRRIDTSFSVWLVMFLPYWENPLRHICQNPVGNPFNLKFNTEMLVLCYDQPLLREWYSLPDNQTRTFNLATWKSSVGIKLKTNSSLYGRRNMFGQTIRVSILEDSLFVELKNGVLTNFLGAVIKELSKSMNFKIEVASSVLIYGSWNEDKGIWTGVIGELISGRADIGVAEFSMTTSRLDIVDFTFPLILSRNRIFFKKPDGSFIHWSAYFKIFTRGIWLVIICLIVTTPVFLTLMKTRGRVVMKILADNYIYVWGIYCQQALSEFPNESSMRLAFLSIFLSSLIVLSAYSASLISFLTVSTVTLPFTTMEEFANHGSYKLITYKNSADYDMIIASNTTLFEKLKKLLKKKEYLPVTAHDGFTQVCSEKVGFYISEAIKKAASPLPCVVASIEADRIDNLGLILKKDSQYTGVVNYYLRRFKDNGVLTKLKNSFLGIKKSQKKEDVTVTLSGVVPILCLLAGGIVFSCLVLMLERTCYNFWHSKYRRTFKSALWRKFFGEKFVVDPANKESRMKNLAESYQENCQLEIPRNKISSTQYKGDLLYRD